jgi:transposase
MNPIEHVWDFIGRKINQRNPKCQNIDELRTAILQEWQQFPQKRLMSLETIKIDITIFLTLLKRLHQGLYNY